jgi:gamma-glutamyltranspeptidase/glutathione hydrolase
MIRSLPRMTKETPLAQRGMVVAAHLIGAEVGASILKRGGNAVDAAVATAFAMTVTEPFMSTIAGGGTMLIHLAKRGETVVLDFNVQAPAACHETIYPLEDGQGVGLFTWRKVTGDANMYGHRSVAVPGSVAGLSQALARYGTMEWADVLAPAIALAKQGIEPDWYIALTMATHAQELAAFPETARTYLKDGHFIHRPPTLADGDRALFPDLAKSLEYLAKEGPGGFYQGAIADAIVAEMQRGGGFITKADLAAYTVKTAAPLTGRYRNLELAFSPGATGGITALEMLNILGCFPSAEVGWQDSHGIHRRAEAVRFAFLDRFKYLGDPTRVQAPWQALAGTEYAAALARRFRKSGRLAPDTAPDAWKYEGRSGCCTCTPSSGPAGGDCTTHIGAVDRQHNMVSLTHTAVSLFGSRVVVPGTGILLSNGMIWFDPEPGRPNSVAPGKRALVNMVPVLAFRRGEPLLTLGAPGGRKIISAIPQVLANIADGKQSPQAAIEAPRVHSEGGDLWVDDRVGERNLAALKKMGHPVVPRHETPSTLFFSRPVAIQVTKDGLQAGLDPFRASAAAGI